MKLLAVLGVIIFGLTSPMSSTSLQDELADFTGQLVKALVKANWALQKKVRQEIVSGHSYVNALILERLSQIDNRTDVEYIKKKLVDEYVQMLDIDKDCTSTEGVVWIANRALRVAENYRQMYIHADVIDICGIDSSLALNKTCSGIISRYMRGVQKVEDDAQTVLGRMESIYDGTLGCIRFRYDSLLMSLRTKSFQ